MKKKPSDITPHQDLLMRMYAELLECPWHKSVLPVGITGETAHVWLVGHGWKIKNRTKGEWIRDEE